MTDINANVLPEVHLPHWFVDQVESRLQHLYPAYQVSSVLHRIVDLVVTHRKQFPPGRSVGWSQEDAILITYGGSVRKDGEQPLRTLGRFLDEHLRGSVNSVHILPLFPYSSDDGFAVIDYRQVNPDLGLWEDVEYIAGRFKLMIDLVLNHCSRENLWFIDFVNNVAPGKDYFIEMDPDSEVHDVVRPRNTPLLVPVHTHGGIRHVWATFSDDQIDLNFRNPDVLLAFISIFLFYLGKGARYVRLDAIAYLWKETGTRCIHLRQTHEVVKLLRDIIQVIDPDGVLITETNVPNGENISYFGNSDEAHMVYQFSLPPLLLHALHWGSAKQLTQWAIDYPRPPKDCTYLNFTASHDGIGLRPLEGILPPREVASLIEAMREYGGYVSMRADPNGVETPYEINITYFDALKGTRKGIDDWQVARFICSQTIMLALQGIPALYIHSLTGTPNDHKGVEQTGRTRAINRHVWELNELSRLLQNPETPQAKVFGELKRRLSIRRSQEAFHPESDQQTIALGECFFALWRLGKKQRILAVNNVTQHGQLLILPPHPEPGENAYWLDLLTNRRYPDKRTSLEVDPYRSLWLEAGSGD